ncbi:MAG: acyl carrier protein [Planctomycetota bacterium]|nr:acyl carrier protein [Planctomycetota bacterium]MDA1252509.1 acyl carrier protein [Planctomycetota bacterium]
MNPSEIRTQLEECFSVVFADLTAEEIPTASMETVEAWDSLGTLTLVGVVEQTFGVSAEIDDIAELVSFEKIAAWLQAVASRQAA